MNKSKTKFRYQEVKEYILKGIKSGIYSPDTNIPSEPQLHQVFSVSNITITRAMKELEQEGYITRIQGKGSFVKDSWNNCRLRAGLLYDYDGERVASILRNIYSQALSQSLHITKNTASSETVSMETEELSPHQVFTCEENSVPDLIDNMLLPVHKRQMDDVSFYMLNDALDNAGIDPVSVLGNRAARHFSKAGHFFQIPYIFFPLVLIYNPEVFDGLGLPYPDALNWQSFISLINEINYRGKCDKSGDFGGIYSFYTMATINRILPLMLQNNAVFADTTENECYAASSECAEAVEFFLSLVRVCPLIPRLPDFGVHRYAYQLFKRKKLAMMFGHAMDLHALQALGAAAGVSGLPQGKRRSTVCFYRSVLVPADTKNTAQAAHIASGFLSTHVQEYIARHTFFTPVIKEYTECTADNYTHINNGNVSEPGRAVCVQKIKESMSYADFYRLPDKVHLYRAFTEELSHILLEGKPVSRALADCETATNNYLQKGEENENIFNNNTAGHR